MAMVNLGLKGFKGLPVTSLLSHRILTKDPPYGSPRFVAFTQVSDIDQKNLYLFYSHR